MKSTQTIGFIGGGRITFLLLQALKNRHALPAQIVVADPNEANLKKVQAISPESISISADNREAAGADIVFLAVHPPAAPSVLKELRGEMAESAVLVSFVPTFSFQKLQAGLGGFDRLVRIIPNAPSIINKGYNPVAFHSAILQEDKARLLHFFYHWGAAPEVDEKLLEACAIIAAMGPTYFWFQWLELQRLAQEFGMKEDAAKDAIAGMLHGAVDTLLKSDLSPAEVLDLIPAYPLKENEEAVREIFSGKLSGLHRKLSEATN